MGKITTLLNEDVGAIGIGAMIVFIAMVLVAGIAASVLIQTSTRLETRAMATGSETTAEVATGIAVIDIEGYTNSSSTDLAYLVIMVRSRAGSDEIDLNTTFIELSDSSKKLVLNYTAQMFIDDADIDGDVFQTAAFAAMQANSFSVIVLEDADSSCSSTTPIINRGDKVMLTVNVSCGQGFNTIAERTDIWGMVIPEEGAPGIVSFRTPESYTDSVMNLQ